MKLRPLRGYRRILHPFGFRHLPLEAESVEPSWNPAGVQLKSSRRRSMTTSEDCWRKKGLLEGLLRGTTWPKTCENIAKIAPRPSKIEPWGLQNRAWSPPRRHFYKTLNLRRFKWADATIFGGQTSQLGSILEAQEGPKSKPKREKIDVGKRHSFDIDF